MLKGEKYAEDIKTYCKGFPKFLTGPFIFCAICLTFVFLCSTFAVGTFFELLVLLRENAGALLELLNKCAPPR
jgi:hypothetical protein